MEKDPVDSDAKKVLSDALAFRSMTFRDKTKLMELMLRKFEEDFDKPLQSYPSITSDQVSFGRDGLLYRNGFADPFTGKVVDRYSNGNILSEQSYLRGIPHGNLFKGHSNGNPSMRALLNKGTLDGVQSRWWENGKLRDEQFWGGGKYHGKKTWDQNGRLIREEFPPPS